MALMRIQKRDFHFNYALKLNIKTMKLLREIKPYMRGTLQMLNPF